MQGSGPSTQFLGLVEAPLPTGAEGLLRFYCVLLWLEAEVFHVLPKPLIEPLLHTGGQPLAAAVCGKEYTSGKGQAGMGMELHRKTPLFRGNV